VSGRVLLPAAVLAALSAPASATVPFSRADMNHDGVVTWDEAHRVFPLLKQIHFEKCDPSGDGMITQGEYPLLTNFYWINYVQRN
jgi:hypothetical protein